MKLTDLESYFERIGYAGPRTPNLEVLSAIQLHHTLTIPFENLDPLLRRPVSLDTEALADKLLRAGRGGYCYEHGCLLLNVLDALGFTVTGLAARVLWNVPPGVVRPRSHMLLRVDLLDAIYVVDVGFGGLTPTAPLRLEPGIVQRTPHDTFRLVTRQWEFILQAWMLEGWRSLYSFDLQPQLLPDYEAMSWYVANHPASHFVTNLLVAHNTPDARHVLNDNQLGVYPVNGATVRRTLGSAAQLRAALETTFGIRLPQTSELEPVLARLADTR